MLNFLGALEERKHKKKMMSYEEWRIILAFHFGLLSAAMVLGIIFPPPFIF
jgi:hypothetical protein